jgi:replication factor A1
MASTSSYVQQEWNMNKPAKKEPIFTKVDQLKPGTKGHTLIAKVLSSQTVDQPRNFLRTPPLANCLIGDETGTIIFTARDEQGPNLLLFHVILISHF